MVLAAAAEEEVVACGAVGVAVAVEPVVAGLAVWAFVDCLTKAPVQFQRAFKRTKGFWLV